MVKIKRTVIDHVPIGLYLVTFERVYGAICNLGEHDDCLEHGCFDNDSNIVSEIAPQIERITRNNYLNLEIDVINKDISLNSKELGVDDTHDLRPRLFKTKKEAKTHADYTLNRFNNPQPWEVFIKY